MTYDPNLPPQPPAPPPPLPTPPGDPRIAEAASKKLAAGLCGLLVGAFGVHKFVLGYTTSGLIMLLVTLLTCGIGGAVMHVIGLVEGIIYLTKSDTDFHNIYIASRKEWF